MLVKVMTFRVLNKFNQALVERPGLTLWTIETKELSKVEIVEILLLLEKSFNIPGMIKLANKQVGLRVHIDGSSIEQQ